MLQTKSFNKYDFKHVTLMVFDNPIQRKVKLSITQNLAIEPRMNPGTVIKFMSEMYRFVNVNVSIVSSILYVALRKFYLLSIRGFGLNFRFEPSNQMK